ncbi:MAG: hypothetical protein HRU69_15360 [Flammeovirgaceae bacterium]|nr:MAG: hypothetical protein HRU69_15360 [Flammeovirgaceae bacterium]
MDDKLNILSNIKAIGWTTLTIFGTVTLWVVFQIIGTIIFDNSIDNFTAGQEEYNDVATNMRDAAIQMRVILFIAGGLTLLTSIGSLGLLRLKNWGLILYQSSTIAVILVFIGGLGYYVYDVQTKMDERYDRALEFGMSTNFVAAQNYTTISYGTFLLLFSWMLTRANIFLSKKDSRIEFR